MDKEAKCFPVAFASVFWAWYFWAGLQIAFLLQCNIILYSVAIPGGFQSLSFQGVSQTEKVSAEKSVFYLLMKMFVTSNHSHLKISTKKLIIKVSV